jgi:hypothetical protein
MSKKKEFKVHIVNSWRDIPGTERGDSSLTGRSDPKTGDIYVVKGASAGVVEHERFHSIKRHPKVPKTYKIYLDNELEAYEYAWTKTKSPRRILSKLRGMYNSCLPYMREGKVKPKEVIDYMKSKIFSLEVPDTWKEDFFKLEKEAKSLENF